MYFVLLLPEANNDETPSHCTTAVNCSRGLSSCVKPSCKLFMLKTFGPSYDS